MSTATKMTDEEYFAAEGVSQSMLKLVAANRMREYEARHVLKTIPNNEPTRDMELGTAIHGVVLMGKRIDDCLAVYPQSCLNKKGGINPTPAEQFRNELPSGVTACKQEEYRGAVRAIDAAMKRLGPILNHRSTLREQPVFWADETGLPCKMKLDIVLPEAHIIIDLKATDDAEPDAFGCKIKKLRYDLQAVTYQEGAMAKWGGGFSFAFLPIEKDGPLYQCSEVRLKPVCEGQARDFRRRLMERLAKAYDDNDFSDDWERRINFIDLPNYLYAERE